ncbi:iron ABC transporter permease protein [Agrobacterium rubi TR3 = NBRC 13261]|uniref:Iron ABC transporter permease protein n=1 Tax=Agrobacterium rubi TR3 = NBRC 13261 TaxID=1368415 RepID=A0A081D0X7_9HYPH|nr:iron ABC transporter permease [Agrobacterium rubi]MBP1881065.1 iron complex transport system permease protein [Agrobacterium rubi]MCL6650708.1 iron ABC transporter [Agrobacterium rubi]GAK72573.1 iron ABC transporter permease protein [Agrobacterium rubi TR3 = NBRC 13261]
MKMKKIGGGYHRVEVLALSVKLHPARLAITTAFLIVLALLVLLALLSGSGRAGIDELVAFVTGSVNQGNLSVIGDLRLPRIIMALSCGAMLGLAGAALQSLTRNGLADPGLLGVREGAALAIVTVIIAFPQTPLMLRPFIGMAGGFAVAAAVALLAGSLSRLRFVLIGIGFSWFLSAVITLLLTVSDIDRVQIALTWMAGSLATVTPDMVPIALTGLCIGAALLFATARAADVATLGDSATIGLGVRAKAFALINLASPVLMTATAVSCVGSIGFVGLIAPHAARMTIGGGQTALLTASMLIGGALVVLADTIGRAAFAPLQIPAGIVLALVGVPVLLLLLWRRRDQL